MSANDRQEGGSHYSTGYQHWDMLINAGFGREYYVGAATKYLTRWRKKNGLLDLRKAAHFIEKLAELVEDNPMIMDERVTDRELQDKIAGELNLHLRNFFDANHVDDMTRMLIIGCMFAQTAAALRSVAKAVQGLIEREAAGAVSTKFQFVCYSDDFDHITWRNTETDETITLPSHERPA